MWLLAVEVVTRVCTSYSQDSCQKLHGIHFLGVILKRWRALSECFWRFWLGRGTSAWTKLLVSLQLPSPEKSLITVLTYVLVSNVHSAIINILVKGYFTCTSLCWMICSFVFNKAPLARKALVAYWATICNILIYILNEMTLKVMIKAFFINKAFRTCFTLKHITLVVLGFTRCNMDSDVFCQCSSLVESCTTLPTYINTITLVPLVNTHM